MDLAIKFTAGVTLRRQLEQALRVAIRSGRLAPGSLLPSSRDLAEELAVSRGVVVDSYSQLAAEGYLSARRGSGTRVALLPEFAGPPVRRQLSPPAWFRYDLRPGQADFHAFPRDRWKAALDRALRQLPAMRLTYADHRGVPELRNAVAEHKTATRARLSGVGVHKLHRHCTVQAPSPPALLLGYARLTASDLSAATMLLADAIHGSVRNPA